MGTEASARARGVDAVSKASQWWRQMKVSKEATPRLKSGCFVTACVADGAESIVIKRETSGSLSLTNAEAIDVARWILETLT